MRHTFGSPVERREARGKITGAARYVDDAPFEGLYGAAVRSTVARGRIVSVTFDPAFPWGECCVVTAADIPAGRNVIAGLVEDQPCLAEREVFYCGEPVVLVAHADRYMAERAREAVSIVYEPLEASTGVLSELRIEKGDVAAGMAGAAFVVEGEYRTAAQEQLYLETQGMIAEADGEAVTVWGSMQCPYYVLGALERTMGVRPRVVQMETGGGFGGKEEYPSVVATYAALLARKAGRPVKMIYDRAEDIAATTKRHPSAVRHRTGVDADGRLVAMEIDVELDGGAYTTLSPVVLSRGCIHAAGAYFCPNVRIRGRVVRSNHVPFGAFRGFGAPQTIFAIERQMEKIAAAAGLDAVEIRRRNFIRQGQETATGQVLREAVLLEELLERALAESGYREKRAAGRRGLGLAVALHGIGFTGSGEKYLRSQVKLERTRAGGARILVSSAEFGQGALTVLPQIVAEELGVALELVEMTHPDTGMAPDSGPTVASRTTMIVGDLLRRAARRMRESGAASVTERYAPPEGFAFDDATNRGDAYETYSWAVDVAEVDVDRETGEARVTDFVAVQDAGRIVNPVLAEGQVAGGAAQGIGLALCEEVVYEDGRVANGNLANYVIPTAADLPPLRVFFVGQEGRVKGLGELPVSGAGPAVANAIADQLGVDADRLPVTAERILECLR